MQQAKSRIGTLMVLSSLLFLFAQPLFSQTYVNDGTVTYYWKYEQVGTCPVGAPSGPQEAIYEYDYYDINVWINGAETVFNASTAYLISPGGSYCPPNGATGTPALPVTSEGVNYVVYFTPESGGSAGVKVQGTEPFYPLYQVVSLLYSPPGNESTQGYTDGTTNGVNTNITNTFSESTQVSVTGGGTVSGITLSGGGTWGYSTNSAISNAYTQTWTDASSYGTDDNSSSYYNPTHSNVMNHNLDTFVIWLNPMSTVVGDGGVPSTFTLGDAPITDLTNAVADVQMVVAQDMEETSSKTTNVPISLLDPIGRPTGGSPATAFMPGLAAICKSQTLYQEQLAYDIDNPSSANGGQYCTQANQCGCTPADFAPILQQDLLLNYTATTSGGVTTYAASPYSQTTNPVSLDASGLTTCSENPIPKLGSNGQPVNCRYVIVPTCSGAGCVTPVAVLLSGQGTAGYAQSDSTASTLTTSQGETETVGVTFSAGVAPFFSFTETDTWSWGETESTGATTGTNNQMSVNLETSTEGCTAEVGIFEDTVYHTYVFEMPSGVTGCP